MSASFRPIRFEAWQKLQLEETDDETLVDCLECHGEGVADCCECGHESECAGCCGDGKVAWGELREHERQRHLTYARYAEAILQDARAWASWLERDPAEELFAAGFRVASSVVSKSLVVLRSGDLH
ncbi:hypothetical protein WCE39_08130 [Luteimonas sp. MJ174]|uniref:hypothetical protein n=1 Tax=Luteimonas sp. MJ174 TaxID=3129237 RepID=UPI0031BB59F9